MATDVISNLSGSLDAELEKARETLRSVDDNIKKVFGKDASELTVFGRGRRPEDDPAKEDHYNNDHFHSQSGDGAGGGRRRRDDFERDGDEPTEKRRRGEGGGSFGFGPAGGGRLGPMMTGGNGPRFGGGRQRNSIDGGGEDEGFAGRRLASRIVSSAKEKSRDEVLAEQRQDRSGRERNRRMFGALLGTLQRFKQDETKLKAKEDKRAVIEAKLDEAAQHEREVVKTKKQELIKERRLRLTEIKRIEVKRRRLAELEQWEEKTKYLTNFIRTEAKPHIFYLPKLMNPIMECRLEQSKQFVTEMISHKRKLVLDDLEDYEQRSKRYWEGRMAGRPSNRKIDPMDADIEYELDEIMKNEDIDVPLEGEDFTITVFTNDDEPRSSFTNKSGSNGVAMKRESVDGKENIVGKRGVGTDDEDNEEFPSNTSRKGRPDEEEEEDGGEITEETIEVKIEEETEEMNTSDEAVVVVAPSSQEEDDSVVDDDQEQEEEDEEEEEEADE